MEKVIKFCDQRIEDMVKYSLAWGSPEAFLLQLRTVLETKAVALGKDIFEIENLWRLAAKPIITGNTTNFQISNEKVLVVARSFIAYCDHYFEES